MYIYFVQGQFIIVNHKIYGSIITTQYVYIFCSTTLRLLAYQNSI